MRCLPAHDTYNRLSRMHLPVYICGGRYDGMSSPANLEKMYKKIPNSYLEFFKGGHRFLYQDTQAFKRIIAQYSSDKTTTVVETAIYRVLKTHNFVLLALNPSVLNHSLPAR
ncbi:alpha/beta fold hydrolase [Nostoc sp. UIC 10890]